jgi:hypothetical protein
MAPVLPVAMIWDFRHVPFPAQLWAKYPAPRNGGRAEKQMPTGFPNRQLRDSWVAGSRRPAILTKMTGPDWISVLKVFRGVALAAR